MNKQVTRASAYFYYNDLYTKMNCSTSIYSYKSEVFDILNTLLLRPWTTTISTQNYISVNSLHME